MTINEWRATYPGLSAVQPHPEAPEVWLMCVGDPLGEPSRGPDLRALEDLKAIDGHKITSDLPARGSYWIAPKVDRDDWTRADYMLGRIDHESYYLSLARCIGLGALSRMVLQIAPIERIREAIQSERHLNAIPLAKWDAYDPSVRSLISEQNRSNPAIMQRSWNGQPLPPGTFCWSLSESVCVLKAVARHLAERPDDENQTIAT